MKLSYTKNLTMMKVNVFTRIALMFIVLSSGLSFKKKMKWGDTEKKIFG
jgi:hypothetical protein